MLTMMLNLYSERAGMSPTSFLPRVERKEKKKKEKKRKKENLKKKKIPPARFQ